MAEVEPTLCHLLKYASRMGQYVSQQNTINMANELIEGKPTGLAVQAWMGKFNFTAKRKAKLGIRTDKKLGWGWFEGF